NGLMGGELNSTISQLFYPLDSTPQPDLLSALDIHKMKKWPCGQPNCNPGSADPAGMDYPIAEHVDRATPPCSFWGKFINL
ncbi:hypothetical protein HAX54_050841, partial [Datura stramonium]|nr:hypothetical protein [Datura stramonium]